MSYKCSFFSPFCLPFGKAEDTPSPSLPRDRSRLLRLLPWTPWIWGILNFRSIRVTVIAFACYWPRAVLKCADPFKGFSVFLQIAPQDLVTLWTSHDNNVRIVAFIFTLLWRSLLFTPRAFYSLYFWHSPSSFPHLVWSKPTASSGGPGKVLPFRRE